MLWAKKEIRILILGLVWQISICISRSLKPDHL
jgi:hypothetical protein